MTCSSTPACSSGAARDRRGSPVSERSGVPRLQDRARAIIHAGAVIGSDGFGFAPDFVGDGDARTGSWVKIPQVGGVSIGPDVEIGANTTIDRGAMADTVIEAS
jgi:hypothetical protein